jgi:hypothetical protein
VLEVASTETADEVVLGVARTAELAGQDPPAAAERVCVTIIVEVQGADEAAVAETISETTEDAAAVEETATDANKIH